MNSQAKYTFKGYRNKNGIKLTNIIFNHKNFAFLFNSTYFYCSKDSIFTNILY